MTNSFGETTNSETWHLLVGAAKRALEEKGYKLARMPGRGLSNVWEAEKNGQKQKVSIRTSRDRWFAFQPLKGGKTWKTLDVADLVVVAAVDNKELPKRVEVYLFPAGEVRKRFDAAYAARTKERRNVPDNFGMWISLGKDPRGGTSAVGSGLAEAYPEIAEYEISSIGSLSADDGEGDEDEGVEILQVMPNTISEVIESAKAKIAQIAGVPTSAVRLDLKIEY